MKNFDLIVIGAGNAFDVLRGAGAAGLNVAVVEKGPLGGTCPNRGCIPSKLVLAHAVHVPAEIELYALHETKLVRQEVGRASAEQLEKLLLDLQDKGIACEFTTRFGNPESVLCEIAQATGADLIVMGTHGRTGFERAVLGSVAERTVALAPCPVMTVREPDDT